MAIIDIDRLRGSKIVPMVLAILIGGGLVWAYLDSQSLLATTGEVVYATSFMRLPVLVYASGIIGAAIIFGQKLFNWKKMVKPFVVIGQYSYLIYLSHTLLLRIVSGALMGNPEHLSLAKISGLFLVGLMVSLGRMA